jgi:putative hydrolase of the HAD superfamily
MLDGVKFILFDAVGTLIYPDPPVAEAYCAVAGQYGSRLSADAIRERFSAAIERGFGHQKATSEADERARWQRIVAETIDDVPQSIDTVFHELWRHFSDPAHWRLYEDVLPVLAALRGRGYWLGIASNFDARLKPIVAAQESLAACQAIFLSSEIGFSKPDLRFFRAVETRLGIEPARIALIGDDAVNDVAGATAAGWRAIYLCRNTRAKSAIQSLQDLL